MNTLVRAIWQQGRLLISELIQDVNDLLNIAGFNNILSRIASIAQSLVGGTMFTDLSVLQNQTVIALPHEQDLNDSPSVSQFLNAANAGYAVAGSPDGMKPFLVDGRQLAITDVASAMSAKVWLTDTNALIIAFQGTTGGDNIFLNPLITPSGFAADTQILNQVVSQAEKDALSFTRYVVGIAEKTGIDTNHVFLTGHSLGGVEASYVAQQTGLAGMAFGAAGIPASVSAVGNGKNFVSMVTHGDPISNYASDTEQGMEFVTAMAPGANNSFNHYGNVFITGAVEDTLALKKKLAGWNTGTFENIAALVSVLPDFVNLHAIGTQAANLGVKLSPHSWTTDGIAMAHGPVLPIGDHSLSQVLASLMHQDTQVTI